MQVVGKYAKSGRETAFTAIGLSKEGANKYMFMLKDRNTGTEKQTSVAQYFTKVLGVQLQFPALQCVLVRSTPASCRAPDPHQLWCSAMKLPESLYASVGSVSHATVSPAATSGQLCWTRSTAVSFREEDRADVAARMQLGGVSGPGAAAWRLVPGGGLTHE